MAVVAAALWLPQLGSELARQTGLGEAFVGSLFIAITTSLPEIVVSLAAVRIGALDLGIGNVLGSNLFNLLILGLDDVFYNDVPPQLAAEAQRRERNEDSKALREPWPLDSWPATPTRYLLCRHDRMFTAAWARRHARARLGIEADEMDGGHYVTLSRPREVAERLHAYAASLA